MDQWLKRTGEQQGNAARMNAPQNEANTKTMGPNSHMSPSRQKKLKQNASGRFNPHNNAESLRRKEQLKQSQDSHSRAVEMRKIEQLKTRVDFNTKTCTKCIKNSPDYKKPHHPTCLDAKAWKPAEKVVLDAMTDWEKQCLNLQTKNKHVQLGLLPRSIFKHRPPPPITAEAKATSNVAVAATHEARSAEKKDFPPLEVPPSPKSPSLVDPAISANKHAIKLKIQSFLFSEMTPSLLKKVLPLVIESWGRIKEEERHKAAKCPIPILALLEHIQMQLPFVYDDKEKKGTRRLGGGDKRIEWYKNHFPPGSIKWTVPVGGRDLLNAPPNPLYESIQGTPIFITRWELNVPELVMTCAECTKGVLLNTRFRSTTIASSVTPIFSVSGQTGWQIGSSYTCSECPCKVRSTDGSFLRHSLPGWLSRSLPLDPKWVNPTNHFQLHKDTAKVTEKVMLTESSGDWMSENLYECQNDFFIELEGSCYTGAIAGIVFDDFRSIDQGMARTVPTIWEANTRAC
jgi:hypothetical protein